MNGFLTCSLALGLILGFTGCSALESINKKPKFTVSLHSQGSDMESPRSIFRYPLPGREFPTIFRRVPEFTQENVAAFHSFPASNGNGFGVTLRLDFRGTNALDLLTRTRTGEVALALVNGAPVDFLSIDSPVTDGVVTIWEGISEDVIKQMAKKWPPINELHSMSAGQEMLPTTRAEKKRSRAAAADALKAQDRKAKTEAGKTEEQKQQTKDALPSAPTTKKIPLEGKMLDQPLPLIKR